MPLNLEKMPIFPSKRPEDTEKRIPEEKEEKEKKEESLDKIITEPEPTAEKKKEQKENAKEKSENKQEISRIEQKFLMEHAQEAGPVFDQAHIIDARRFWPLERCIQYFKDRDGTIPHEILLTLESGQAEIRLLKEKIKELKKLEDFNKYLESFEGKLRYARINPAGETSPVSPSQAIEINPDGTFRVTILQEFIEQIKKIKEQAKDLTLVVPFYDHRLSREKASDVPTTQEQIEKYIAICEKIIEEVGSDIRLELGNETNVARSTGKMFEDKLQHASHVDATEYGHFFFEVARRIKEKSPAVKLSVAGIALFDPTYLREVLKTIKQLQTENRIDTKLVDTISFHPYRKTAESGAIEVKDGRFVKNALDYKSQLKEMKQIASEFGVELRVGEINFSPFNLKELEQATSLTAKSGVISFVYPSVNMPES